MRQARAITRYSTPGSDAFAFLTNGNRGTDVIDAHRGNVQVGGNVAAQVDALEAAARNGSLKNRRG